MSAIARLFEPELPRLRRHARVLTQHSSQADDLVQSCLVRALGKEHLWQPGTNLRAWLFTILHNQHVNNVRRSVREGASIAVEDVDLAVAPTAGAGLELRDLETAPSYTSRTMPDWTDRAYGAARRRVLRSAPVRLVSQAGPPSFGWPSLAKF